ncbi:class I SAM-dependent methyltransferase [Cellulomonas alba]|uniref:Class I SAM-dependent methyltransferase n=1 Tax=Cellulomonas alba TaxID=3053467 RepID=A0ABT7SIK2_9CELL|nr:class I SAM-dependent methyltransferase [Cellulomonas alba]MDM7855976.1 class I SAM-dependent methyltransferase [Cellulomonas alba]
MSTTDAAVRVLDDPAAGERPFVPGTGNPHLMWTYDLMTRLARVGRVHEQLLEVAGVGTRQRVLEVGCGTGNLALRAARRGAIVTGLDPDRGALEKAAAKARRAGLPLTLVRGYADHLPAEDGSLDHVVSAFALHHVPTEQKAALAAELARVLAPGGRVTIADLQPRADGRSHRGADRAFLADNADHGIERLLRSAGLVDVAEVAVTTTMRQPVVHVRAIRP